MKVVYTIGPGIKPENDTRTPEQIEDDILANMPQSTRANEIRQRRGLPDPSEPETVSIAGEEISLENPVTTRAQALSGYNAAFGLPRGDRTRDVSTRDGGGSFNQVMRQLTTKPGELQPLTEQDQADLSKITEAQKAAAETAFQEEKDVLMRDLFGRGVQRSTIAGEAGGRLLGRRAMVLAGIEGEAGARRIGLRQDIRDARLRALLGAGQLSNQRYDANVRLKVGMASVDAQNRATGASLKIAAMNDATRRQLGLAELSLNERLGMRGLDIQEKSISAQNKRSIIGAIGSGIATVASAAILASHSKFKTAVETESDLKEKMLTMVDDLEVRRFKYKPELGDGREHIGVMADEAPGDISNGLGIVTQDMLFSLVAAVQALSKRVRELEDK